MNPSAIIFSLVGVALLAGLFVWMSPEPAPATGDPASSALQQPALLEIDLRAGSGSNQMAVIQVTQGREVRVRVQADQADELHLHGYDLTLAVAAGEPAELRFVAELTGRFELELHGAHREVGAIEVFPAP
mgnify:CR=1 FL=1